MFEPTQYLFDVRDSIPVERIFRAVFRTEFTQPGFALIRMPGDTDSLTLRRSMVILKDDLSRLYVQQFQHSLTYLSLARFNQQVTTKFHLDGSPETAFLMLGYELSDVGSELIMADYSRAAFDLHISPQQFLDDYNPMYRQGEETLSVYQTPLKEFSAGEPQIVLINNSFAPYDGLQQQGVMHKATIVRPCRDKQRVINSTMLGPEGVSWKTKVTDEDVQSFQTGMPVAQGEYA